MKNIEKCSQIIQIVIPKIDFVKLLKKSGINPRELAKLSGISIQTIYNARNKKNYIMSVDNWNKIKPHLIINMTNKNIK